MKTLLKTFKYLKPYQKYFISLVLLNIVIACVAIAPSFVLKHIIDTITLGFTTPEEFKKALLLIGLLLLVQSSEEFFDSLNWYLSVLWRRTIRDNLVLHVMATAFGLKQSYYQDKTVGEIIEKINSGIAEATSMYLFYPKELIRPITQSVASLTIITAIDPRIGFLLALLAPPYAFFNYKRSQINRKYLPDRRAKEKKAHGAITEALYSLESSKVNSDPKNILQKSKRLLNASFALQKGQARWQNIYGTLSGQTIHLAFGIALLFTSIEIYNGNMTLGDLVLVSMLSNNLLRPIANIIQQQLNLQVTIIGLERFFEVLEAPNEQESFTGEIKPQTLSGSVEFQDVTFGYEKEDLVLKNISFAIPEGATVALVGPSGSGKTTITKLITGLYIAQKGNILIDEKPITNYDIRLLRQHMAVVFQDPFVFSDTLKNNLRFVRPNATNKEIINALKQAHLYDFVKTLPKGLNTQVGERGVKLSGGQKQRLAIAQAFLKNARIIIFDEATSALDAENERNIQKAMNHLMQDRTTFVISHRLATVMNADFILVMNKGKVVDIGTHAELVKKEGIYQTFYQMQIKNPLDKDLPVRSDPKVTPQIMKIK